MRLHSWHIVVSFWCIVAATPVMAAVRTPLSTIAFAQAPAVRPSVPGAPLGITAFINVGVVPMHTERVLLGQTVLIDGGWITALGPTSKVKIPIGAVRIDGRGKYLIPGLADMHAHIAEMPESVLLRFLAHGITTLRNMDHGQDTALVKRVLQWRARIAAGDLVAPRIYTAGPWYAYGRSQVTDFRRNGSPAEVAQRIAAYKAAGYDFVKPYTESREVFDSVAAAARRMGLPLAGHVPSAVPLSVALASMKSIEHQTGTTSESFGGFAVPLGGLTEEAGATEIGAMAGAFKHAGVWLCPTASILSVILKMNAPAKPALGRRIRQSYQLIKALQDSGAGLLLGADAPGAGPFGLSIHRELEVLVREVGLTPYQALVAGTRNVAMYFGTLDSSGTITVGKRADLMLLRGDPLQEIRYTREPAGVMLGGRWLGRVELDLQLATSPSPGGSALEWLFSDVITLRGMGDTWGTALSAHRARFQALTDSLARSAGSGMASERLRVLQLIAEQLGALRTRLPSEQQHDVFDPAARVWMREQLRQGIQVAVPAVAEVP